MPKIERAMKPAWCLRS